MNRTAVVIPNLNGMAYLEACLTSLQEQSEKDFEVLLIDNGSTDGSVEYVRRQFPEVRIHRFAENTGFCVAVNTGIRMTDAPVVILLNNDTICDRDFVRALLDGMDRHPACFSCGAKMLQMDHPSLLDNTGDAYCALGWAFSEGKGKENGTEQDDLSSPRGNDGKEPGLSKPGDKTGTESAAEKTYSEKTGGIAGKRAGRYLRERRIFAACAGAAAYRRSVLEQIGLFDERHFAYLEDIDIGYRSLLYGYENWIIPAAVVLHKGSAVTGSAHNAFKVFHAARNNLFVIRKNMPAWQILLNLPLLVAGALIKLVFFTVTGYGGQYLKGIREGLTASGLSHVHAPGGISAYMRVQILLWKNVFRRFL